MSDDVHRHASHAVHDAEWRRRIATKMGASAVIGTVCGTFLATMHKQQLAKVVPAVGLNFVIFTGCFASTQELIRSVSGQENWMNSALSGAITGGFFSGLQGGPKRILPGVIVFGSGLGLLHCLDDYLQFGHMYKQTLNAMDLLDLDEQEMKAIKTSQTWNFGKYWPSFIPPPIRFLSPEEVEQQKLKRKLRIKELHEGEMVQNNSSVLHEHEAVEAEAQPASADSGAEKEKAKQRKRWFG